MKQPFFLNIFALLTLLGGGMSASVAQAAAITPERVVELVNTDRARNSLPTLTVDAALTQAAQAKANDMVTKGYFAHVSPEGKTPWYWIDQSGYAYHYAGENLAIRFTDAQTQQEAWMNSPTHRANLLSDRYQNIGVAVVSEQEDGHPVLVTVQEFGTKTGVVLPPATQVKAAQAVKVTPSAPMVFVNTTDPIDLRAELRQGGMVYGLSLVQLGLMFSVSFAELLAVVFFGRMIRRSPKHTVLASTETI